MKITTTCIGAYPKPGYIEIGNFAESEDQDDSATRAFTCTHDTAEQVAEELLIRALAEAGCKYVQVDEPLFVRKVDDALSYGVECLDRCFDGVPADVRV
jgi:methionine synthase II (cobalamin-independent)